MIPVNHVTSLGNGNLIETLDNAEYKSSSYMQHVNPVKCSYITSNEIVGSIKNNISVICANIRSMKQNFALFAADLLSNPRSSFDVIGFCETHLNDDTQKLFLLDNYNFYATNVSHNKGGVCLYISDRFNSKIRADLCVKTDHLETVFADCFIDNKWVVYGVIYHRPGTSILSFQNDLTNLLEKVNSRCVLMGDFNVNILNEPFDNNINRFTNSLREHAFRPIITKPTRVINNSMTLIDHFWVNFEQPFGFHSNIVLSNITDHYPIIFYQSLKVETKISKVISFRRKGNFSDSMFKEKLRNSNISDILELDDVNQAFNTFNETILA